MSARHFAASERYHDCPLAVRRGGTAALSTRAPEGNPSGSDSELVVFSFIDIPSLVVFNMSESSPRVCQAFYRALLSRLPYAEKKRPWWCLPVQPFPVDVWIVLLLAYCKIDNTNQGIARRRRAICFAAPEINKLIHDRPLFWSWVYMDCNTYETDLARDLALSGNSDLHVEANLRVESYSESPFEYGQVLPGLLMERAGETVGCLQRLLEISRRWVSLIIKINGPQLLVLAKDFLISARAPSLVVAVIESSYSGGPRVPEMLGRSLCSLTALRVVSFPVVWLKSSPFGCLRHLDVKNISPSDHPSQTEFTDILRRLAPSLEHLSMGATGMRESPDYSPGCFQMDRLQRLELVFLLVDPRQTGFLVSVLGGLTAPCITHFRLVNCDSTSSSLIADGIPFVGGVTHLSVSRGAATLGSVSALMRSMPWVVLADFGTAPGAWASTLAAHPGCWPRLVSASCSTDALTAFRTYAAGRALYGLPSMQSLICMYHPRLGVGDADSQVLSDLRVLVNHVAESPLVYLIGEPNVEL
ncbi:hypothetical protein B0H16DRAFT_1761343 [Mycena metata]|uniref:Uncharacterized protein n=1 Tax=Mycena metata TaxID=1033252 RepID=A0AAD7MZ75_9AGAR|nr:hypothetical protein B0H16DRAFT_1761343 [Mycena metata]